MRKALVLLLILMSYVNINAGLLADKFNAFTKMQGVTAVDCTEQMKQHVSSTISAKMATPVSNSNMMQYPTSFASFYKGLPANKRLNKGKLEPGEPEVFFMESTPNGKAEAIIIFYGDNGINMVALLVIPSKGAKELKDSFGK
ncbi:MAG: hypothetical protein HDS18_04215 [Bacteroides sp.]|nr:hypothetical protein [Bacteroides sp.]